MSRIILKHQASAPTTPATGETAIWVDSATKRILTRDDAGVDFDYARQIVTSTGPTALTVGAVADGQMFVRSGATVVGQAVPSGGAGPYTVVGGFESDGGGTTGDGYYETTNDVLNVGSFTLLIMVRLLWIDNGLTSRFQIMGTTQSFGSEGHGIEILTGFGGGETSIRASTTGDAGTRANADSVIDHAVTVGRWLTLVCRRDGSGANAVVSGFANGHLFDSATVTGEPGAEPTGALTLGAPRGGGNGVVDAAEGVDFRGAGVVLGALSDAEIGEWSAACLEGEDVVAVPTGTGLSHRWRATGFADPWPDDIGSEDLNRVGTATALGTKSLDRFVI